MSLSKRVDNCLHFSNCAVPLVQKSSIFVVAKNGIMLKNVTRTSGRDREVKE